MRLAPVPSLWGGAVLPGCLLDAFPRALSEHPERVAVVAEDATVTYRELLGWAARVAAVLRAHDVARGERVAIACPRGAHAVAAMLGVVLSGACYVPLDRDYPPARLRHMLDDSGARVVLWTGTPVDFADGATPVEVPGPECLAVEPAELDWLAEHDPDLPVYVIYTSGSTGWPKGVVLQHSVLDNVAYWQTVHTPAADLRTAQFAPLNFDVSYQEVFGTLVGGGTLAVVPERLRRDPAGLLAWLVEHRVQRVFLPYVALQMLAVAVAYGEPMDGLELREVNVAGEQLVCTGEVRALFEAMPGCRLVNHYGQSESAMVSAHVLTGTPDSWPTLVPIGRPLPGCELLLADVGDPDERTGELLVGGAAVSHGYLDRPELNAQRYAEVEPTEHGTRRVFRTGDLVRFDGGVVRYLSRLDDDVKLRGIRINLAEVEAQLLRLPGIAAAIAVVTGAQGGPMALRAAVVPADKAAGIDEDEVLARLADVLPEVAVPAALTVIDSVPRAPSGKADRIAVGKLVDAAVSQ